MQTQLMNCVQANHAWLQAEGTEQRTPLETLPLTIGRTDRSDLAIDSDRVSREHAVIEKKNGKYYVRDLGSTNGTHVNNQKVSECELVDQDVLLVADVPFVFHLGTPVVTAGHRTEVMSPESDSRITGSCAIRSLRGIQEMLINRAVQPKFSAIARLSDSDVVGCSLTRIEQQVDESTRRLLSIECRMNDRLRQLIRFVALEEAQAQGAKRLAFSMEASEVGGESSLDAITRLSQEAASETRLTAFIPIGAAADLPYFRDFVREVQSLEIELGFDGFFASASRLTEYAEDPPKVIRLVETIAARLSNDAALRNDIAALVAEAGKMGVTVLVPGVSNESQAAVARDLGCDWGEGDHFGKHLTLHSLFISNTC